MNAEAVNNEEHFVELETRLAYAEDLLDSLNRTVAGQQMELLELRKLCGELLQQIRELSNVAQPQSAADDVPPHY
jgi:SlyX protein